MMKLIFQSEHFEEHKISKEKLIRLFPYGITLEQVPGRPILLLKDESGQNTLPVAITQLEAGVAVQQGKNSGGFTGPHHVTKVFLESLNIKIEKCVFVEIKAHHQYVRLTIDGHPNYGSLKFKADEVMSLCLFLNVPIFATKKIMQKSQSMSAELEGLAKGLQLNPNVMIRTHEYLC